MFDFFKRNVGQTQETAHRERISLGRRPDVVYAIGDVHGCYDELVSLERLIASDAATVRGPDKFIVTLGDYLDRGPASANVIDHLMKPAPDGMQRLCLCGNHEQICLDALRGRGYWDRWLPNGGRETLISYGADQTLLEYAEKRAKSLAEFVRAYLPLDHIAFLEKLAVCVTMPGFIFAHAGVRPGVSMEAQTDRDLMWIRDDFFSSLEKLDVTVVHGHTPVPEPVIGPHHVNVDTGAYATARLSATKITADGSISFLCTK